MASPGRIARKPFADGATTVTLSRTPVEPAGTTAPVTWSFCDAAETNGPGRPMSVRVSKMRVGEIVTIDDLDSMLHLRRSDRLLRTSPQPRRRSPPISNARVLVDGANRCQWVMSREVRPAGWVVVCMWPQCANSQAAIMSTSYSLATALPTHADCPSWVERNAPWRPEAFMMTDLHDPDPANRVTPLGRTRPRADMTGTGIKSSGRSAEEPASNLRRHI